MSACACFFFCTVHSSAASESSCARFAFGDAEVDTCVRPVPSPSTDLFVAARSAAHLTAFPSPRSAEEFLRRCCCECSGPLFRNVPNTWDVFRERSEHTLSCVPGGLGKKSKRSNLPPATDAAPELFRQWARLDKATGTMVEIAL